MPIYNRRFVDKETKQPAAPHLINVGPRLPIQIGIPGALARFLTEQNQKIPPPVAGYCLIDTGASVSSVDENVIDNLGVQPIGKIDISTPDKKGARYVYPALFIFPAPLPTIEFSRVASLKLSHLKIIALLGRDFLGMTTLFYNGQGATFTLSL